MKFVLNWLFGVIAEYPLLLDFLIGILFLYALILFGWATVWMFSFLPWPHS